MGQFRDVHVKIMGNEGLLIIYRREYVRALDELNELETFQDEIFHQTSARVSSSCL